jgi:protein-S-isoprenylcysteine O-methyltransferase Ste14
LFGPLKSFERTKVYDLAAASPLIALYGWVLVRDWPSLRDYFGALAQEGLDIALLTETFGLCLSLGVAGLLIVLVLIRTLPVKKSVGIAPRAVALIGAGGGVVVLMLPPAMLPLWLDILSAGIILFGLCAMLVCLAWLRRSFSVLPEARRLVTSGPYSLIRHPVYLSEEITLFGVMLQFVQPWAFLVFAIQLCFQFARIPFEERVLADAYPEYAEYSSRTARLLPGIY